MNRHDKSGDNVCETPVEKTERAGCRVVRVASLYAAAAIVAMTAQSAVAQISALPARTDVAGARVQPEFTPIPMKAGPTTVSAGVRMETGYDNNLFGDESAPVEDVYVLLAPSFRAATDWNRHGIVLSGGAAITRFAQTGVQNTTDHDLRAGFQLDLPDTQITFDAGASRVTERRIVSSIPLSRAGPSAYGSLTQGLSVRHGFASGAITARISHAELDYADLELSDGRRVSQAFRDVEQWTAEASIGVVPSASVALHAFGSFSHSEAPAPFARDSDSLSAGAGFGIDLQLVRVEGELGYLGRRFSNPALRDFSGVVYRSSAAWYATPLITITLTSRQSITESGIETVGAIVSRVTRADVDYEVMRNLLVRAFASHNRQSYRESDGRVILRRFGIEGEYSFNRIVSFGAYARSECRRPSASALASRYCSGSFGFVLNVRR